MKSGCFQLEGDASDQALLAAALNRGRFPWDRLVPGLVQQVGRDYVPVKFSDLSRFTQGRIFGDGDDHAHDHHADGYHTLEVRRRVLGLFWLDHRIEVDVSLRDEPELLAEVVWSEVAHCIDYALLTDEQRVAIAAAFHVHSGADHHLWWEKADYSAEYRDLIGEAFMAAICQAYTDIEPTIILSHHATEAVGLAVKRIITPDLVVDPFFGKTGKSTFHDKHRGVPRDLTFPTYEAAIASGRRPCRICRPKAL